MRELVEAIEPPEPVSSEVMAATVAFKASAVNCADCHEEWEAVTAAPNEVAA